MGDITIPTMETVDDHAIVRWIIDKGLKNPDLRSEIYCQIVKQIIQNPSKYVL